MVAPLYWRSDTHTHTHTHTPVSDLFVSETKFDGKGFEWLEYIDRHFHPSWAVNLLRYIFDLIDIKQKDDKLIVSLMA